MKKTFFLLSSLFLLNGCAESVALLGSSVGGASNGKMLQSSVNSVISFGIKKQTGKTPLEHAFAYAEEKNPEKKIGTSSRKKILSRPQLREKCPLVILRARKNL